MPVLPLQDGNRVMEPGDGDDKQPLDLKHGTGGSNGTGASKLPGLHARAVQC
jgi:hypothetical protein